MTGDLGFGDNDKAIFGAGSDLQIYHSGTHSYIKDSGTGNLNILASTSINLLNGDSSDYMARFNENGSNQFFYDGSQKLATTSTGVDITGTITSDDAAIGGTVGVSSLDLGSSSTFNTGTTAKVTRTSGAGTGIFAEAGHLLLEPRSDAGSERDVYIATDSLNRFQVNNNGDISFYEDTGTTPKFFWDASAESLGIGTTSPAVTLHATSGVARTSTAKTETAFFATDDVDDYRFGLLVSHKGGATGADRYASIDSTSYQVSTDTFSGSGALVLQQLGGNVGIGTSSPTGALDIGGQHVLYDNYNSLGASFTRNGEYGSVLSLGRQGVSSGVTLDYPADSTFALSTNNAERMRITSSGNVGIGTSSPSAKLDVKRTDASGQYAYFGASSDGGARGLSFTSSDNGIFLGAIHTIDATSGSGQLALATGGSERMRIDSSGNVGIGTSSPSQDLEILNGVTGAGIRLAATDAAYWDIERDSASGNLTFTDDAAGTVLTLDQISGNVGIGTSSPSRNLHVYSGSEANIRLQGGSDYAELRVKDSDNALTFHYGGSETMRNSGAEFYIGHTGGTAPWAMSGSQYGISLMGSGGFIGAARANAEPLLLNRTGSDGAILNFRKDGTTVGSIGNNGDNLVIESTDTGLLLNSGAKQIIPTGGSLGIEDATIDLGRGTTRFKDLYLSGGVYLGGTGSSNRLNSYEEGTWTPVVKTGVYGTTMTYSTDYEFRSPNSNLATDTLTYTKIGNRVFVSFSFWSNTSQTIRFNISLPFVFKHSPYQVVSSCPFYKINTAAGIGILGAGSSTFDTFALDETGNHGNVSLATDSEIYYNFSYETT
jgi:hypothetical protein